MNTISVMYLLTLACYDEAQANQMFYFESNCICPEFFFAGYKIKISYMTINTFGVFLIFTKE